MLLIPVLAREMLAQDLGVLLLVLAMAVPCSLVLSGGIPAVVTRLVLIDGLVEAGIALTRRALLVAGLFAAIGLIGVYVGFAVFGGALTVWASTAMSLILGSLLRAQSRPRMYLGLVFATYVVPTGCNVVMGLSVERLSAETALSVHGHSQFVCIAAVSAICRFWGRRRYKLRKGIEYRFGLLLVPHSVALAGLAALDKLIIGARLDASQVAIYQMGYLYGSAALAVVNALNIVFAPAAYSIAASGTPDRFYRIWVQQLSVGVVLCAGAFAIIVPFLALVVPAGYPSGLVTNICLVTTASAIPYCFYLYASHRLFISGRSGLLAFATPATLFVSVPLVVMGLSVAGLWGAAVASLLSYIILAVMATAGLRRATYLGPFAALGSGSERVPVGLLCIGLFACCAWLLGMVAFGAILSVGVVVRSVFTLWRIVGSIESPMPRTSVAA